MLFFSLETLVKLWYVPDASEVRGQLPAGQCPAGPKARGAFASPVDGEAGGPFEANAGHVCPTADPDTEWRLHIGEG